MPDKIEKDQKTKQEAKIEDLPPAEEQTEQVKGGPKNVLFMPSIS
jgi:hypothetical protein